MEIRVMNEYGIDLSQDVLSDLFEIEQALSMMKDSSDEQEFLKNLKKRRVSPIDDKIKKLENNKEKLKSMILKTMRELKPKQKTIDFPGVAKVTRRAVKGSWSVVDESALKKELERLNLKNDIVKTEEKIDKKKLNSALTNLDKQNSTINGVQKSQDHESISISYAKDSSADTIEASQNVEAVEQKDLKDLLV